MKKFRIEFNQCKESLYYIKLNPKSIEIPPCFDKEHSIEVKITKGFSFISGWVMGENGMVQLTTKLNKNGTQINYINGIRI